MFNQSKKYAVYCTITIVAGLACGMIGFFASGTSHAKDALRDRGQADFGRAAAAKFQAAPMPVLEAFAPMPVLGALPPHNALSSRLGLARMSMRDPNQRVRTFVDGNNLMGSKKVTKGRDNLASKISGIRTRQVILVFDGKFGEAFDQSGADPEVVVTTGGDDGGGERMSADEWIVSQIHAGDEVVTADRQLRKLVQGKAAKTINPIKWWRRYMPRLKGLKSDYTNARQAN